MDSALISTYQKTRLRRCECTWLQRNIICSSPGIPLFIHGIWSISIVYPIVYLLGVLEHLLFSIYIYGIRNNHPNWPSYFSEGLKPPTRFKFFDVSKQLRVPELLNLGLLSDQINTYGVATSQDRAEYLHISRRDGGFHGAFGARIRKTDLYIFVLAIGIVSRVRNLQKKYIYIYSWCRACRFVI